MHPLLLIAAQDHGMVWWRDVQANDVFELLGKFPITRQFEDRDQVGLETIGALSSMVCELGIAPNIMRCLALATITITDFVMHPEQATRRGQW
jgi:hypothetical protein